MQVVIRQCSADDLAELARFASSAELTLHELRFAAQERGEITYLLAWDDDKPAGHIKIHWKGSVHANVRAQFPSVPEFRRLRVEPSMQGKGMGSKLLAAAEQYVAMQGFYFAGLCVAESNVGAIRLYERHGYVDWGQGLFESTWEQRNDDGSVEERSHTVTYMTKALNQERRSA